jgi:protein-S-isoprenylcysteine O-methyltransferase Ste14
MHEGRRYATLFIGFLLVFLPARALAWSGIVRPATLGVAQLAGIVVGASGAALAVWCIITFVVTGRGTPAPFDPPRRLEEPTLRATFGDPYVRYCERVQRWWRRLHAGGRPPGAA